MVERSFIVGDEWLYFKVYCGLKIADDLLVDIIKPIKEELMSNAIIDKCFFIRYSDPENHLRVRFHVTSISNISYVIALFNKLIKQYVENDLVWKVQLDTYHREVERYGINTMVLSESYFHFDSDMVINAIESLHDLDNNIDRWLFGVKALDSLLNEFKYDLDDKIRLLNKLKMSFNDEFGMNKSLKIQIDRKFRKFRDLINKSLIGELYLDGELNVLLQHLDNKTDNTSEIVNEIIGVVNYDYSNQLDNLLGSFIHMMLNRLFRSKQRKYELVIYNLMAKYYTSEKARNKKHEVKV